MVTTDRIAAATSYSLGGANMRPPCSGSLGPCESAPKRHLERFSRFAWFTGVPNRETNRHTYHAIIIIIIIILYFAIYGSTHKYKKLKYI